MVVGPSFRCFAIRHQFAIRVSVLAIAYVSMDISNPHEPWNLINNVWRLAAIDINLTKRKVEKAAPESCIFSSSPTSQLHTAAVASKQVTPTHSHTDV